MGNMNVIQWFAHCTAMLFFISIKTRAKHVRVDMILMANQEAGYSIFISMK